MHCTKIYSPPSPCIRVVQVTSGALESFLSVPRCSCEEKVDEGHETTSTTEIHNRTLIRIRLWENGMERPGSKAVGSDRGSELEQWTHGSRCGYVRFFSLDNELQDNHRFTWFLDLKLLSLSSWEHMNGRYSLRRDRHPDMAAEGKESSPIAHMHILQFL